MGGAVRGLGVCSALWLMGCPQPVEGTGDQIPSELGEVEIPEKIRMGEPIVAIRVSQSESNSGTAVHRALGRIFAEQLSAADGLMRGGLEPTGEGAGGTAADQVQLMLDAEAALAPDVAVDACGNPMLASFLTAEALTPLIPSDSRVTVEDVLSPDALTSTVASGVWDVKMGEARFDGLVDAVIDLYPAPTENKPAFLGHVAAFFLTEENYGAAQLPLYVSAGGMQIAMSGMMGLWKSYTDPHYQDGREIFIFPQAPREIRSAFVGLESDDECSDWFNGLFTGPLPFGCDIDGSSNVVSIDSDSVLGATVLESLTDGGKSAEVLARLQQALQYQIATFVACPTFTEPSRVVDGPVELLICPDGDFAMCFGQHDMEQAACDFEDEEAYPPNIQVPASVIGGGGEPAPILPLDDFPYLLTFQPPVDPDDGGEDTDGGVTTEPTPTGSGMRVGVDGAAGQTIYLQSDAWNRITLLDGSNRPLDAVDVPNTHCTGTLHAWTFPTAGRYWIQASGESDLLLLMSDPLTHAP